MERKTLYYPPQADILEIKPEGVMCVSQPVDSEDGWGENRVWEEL